MVEQTRIGIYDYLYNITYDVVTKNVYSMREPQELTKSDTDDGFLVIVVGDIHDESEFSGQTYGWTRCYIEAFVPPISRGRLNYDKYKVFEDGINNVIANASAETSGTYHVVEEDILSTDGDVSTNANNSYFTFIKSFIIIIDKQE